MSGQRQGGVAEVHLPSGGAVLVRPGSPWSLAAAERLYNPLGPLGRLARLRIRSLGNPAARMFTRTSDPRTAARLEDLAAAAGLGADEGGRAAVYVNACGDAAVVCASGPDGRTRFVKIGFSEVRAQALERERLTLDRLAAGGGASPVRVPRVTSWARQGASAALGLDDASAGIVAASGVPRSSAVGPLLRERTRGLGARGTVADSAPGWFSGLDAGAAGAGLRDAAAGLCERLRTSAAGEVGCDLAHGDFAPWNITFDGERLAVWDWEDADPAAPSMYDAMHYDYQVLRLVSRLGVAAALQRAAVLSAGSAPGCSAAELGGLYAVMRAVRDLRAGRDPGEAARIVSAAEGARG